MSMSLRVLATDGLHLAALLSTVERYDAHADAVDATGYSFTISNMGYWLYVDLTDHKATFDPPFIWR